MAIWIKNPLGIFADDGVDAGGGLIVDDAVITELVPAGREPSSTFSRWLDASDHVIVPGLINTHHHYYQTLTRGFGATAENDPVPWRMIRDPIWARLRPSDVRLAAKLTMCELLLSGCTTSVNHHDVFPKGLKHAIDIEAEVATDLQMRAVFARGSMNLSIKDGSLPPDDIVQDNWAILTDSERLVKKHNLLGDRSGAMIEIVLAPCSPLLVSSELMRATAVMAEHLECRLHTQFAETDDEDRLFKERFRLSPLDYLEEHGWLSDKTWIAHGVHFSDSDIRRFAAAGTAIAFCPTAHWVRGSYPSWVNDAMASGVPIGLAVRSSAANASSNLMREVRLVLKHHGLSRGRVALTHREAFRLATEGSARCLARADIGKIAVGKQADLAFFKLNEQRCSAGSDPVTNLILSEESHADRVMVAGRWLVENGQLSNVDLPKLKEARNKAARRLSLT
ncbi:MAG: amidohydrolase family protein [Pseudomonadota bacterium]